MSALKALTSIYVFLLIVLCGGAIASSAEPTANLPTVSSSQVTLDDTASAASANADSAATTAISAAYGTMMFDESVPSCNAPLDRSQAQNSIMKMIDSDSENSGASATSNMAARQEVQLKMPSFVRRAAGRAWLDISNRCPEAGQRVTRTSFIDMTN